MSFFNKEKRVFSDIYWVFQSFGLKAAVRFTYDTVRNMIRKVNDKPIRCIDCGGVFKMTCKPGRTREVVAGMHVPIPDNFPIMTCDGCQEEMMGPETSDVLDAILLEHISSDKPKVLH